jgi:surfeit locus 1 family protein
MSEATAPRRGWSFWAFIVLMLALMALFIGLGTWQVRRLEEKERLIASVASGMTMPPVDLVWSIPAFDAASYVDPQSGDQLPLGMVYRQVKATGHYLPDRTVLVFTSLGDANGAYSGPGYWVMTPFELSGQQSVVFINRGFVPQEQGPAFVSGGAADVGEVTLTGIARSPEPASSFTPQPDSARRIDWVRDPARLAALAGPLPDPVAPIYVDLPAGPPGALPQGGETVVSFPNNHLGYAITWFGFAALIPPLLWFWARRQR